MRQGTEVLISIGRRTVVSARTAADTGHDIAAVSPRVARMAVPPRAPQRSRSKPKREFGTRRPLRRKLEQEFRRLRMPRHGLLGRSRTQTPGFRRLTPRRQKPPQRIRRPTRECRRLRTPKSESLKKPASTTLK